MTGIAYASRLRYILRHAVVFPQSASVFADHYGFLQHLTGLVAIKDQLQGHSESRADARQLPDARFYLAGPAGEKSLLEGFPGENCFFEFLGELVRSLSRRNAGYGTALSGV